MVIKGSSLGQEEINIIPLLKKGKEKDLGNCQVVNHNSIPDGVSNPGKHF